MVKLVSMIRISSKTNSIDEMVNPIDFEAKY